MFFNNRLLLFSLFLCFSFFTYSQVNDCANVSVSADGGSYHNEVGWEIIDANGTVLVEGGAPYIALACLDLTVCYTVQMTDSYGDGWNGNVLTIGDSEEFSLYAGSSGSAQFGTCDVVFGCTDETACNYNVNANFSTGDNINYNNFSLM